jgi:hypothetical protein
MLHQVGDLFELNVKLRCQKVNENPLSLTMADTPFYKGMMINYDNFLRRIEYYSNNFL